MSIKTPHTAKRKDENNGLGDILGYLHEAHAVFAGDAKDSKTLLELGVKTETAQYWESVLENPFNPLLEMGDKIDQMFYSFANDIVKSYLVKNKKIVSKAYAGNIPLHYCIVLKEDTSKNRMEINKFFPAYNDLKFAEKYPVLFQFVPEALSKNLVVSQEIL